MVRICPDHDPANHLSIEDKVVLSQVADPDDEAELLVPHGDDGVVAEDDGLAPVPRSRQFREHEADHEGLHDAAEDGLEADQDHGLRALGGRLPRAIADGVLRLQRVEETGTEAIWRE